MMKTKPGTKLAEDRQNEEEKMEGQSGNKSAAKDGDNIT